MAKSDVKKFQVGIVGLGPQGRSLARSFDEQRITVVVYDRSQQNIDLFRSEAPRTAICIAEDLRQFMESLGRLRTVVATGPVGAGESYMGLLAHLEAGDVLIEAGRGHFRDCDQRANLLAARDVRYLGLGILGGEDATCCGAVLMSSGRPDIHENVCGLLEVVATKFNGQPCIGYVGRAPAAHFVRVVHDGIEDALRQSVLETVELTKRAMAEATGPSATLQLESLASSLLEISGHVRSHPLPCSNECAQWTSQVARQLEIAAPTIDAAAGAQILSSQAQQNDFATTPHRQPIGRLSNELEEIVEELHGALRAAVLITYAQGLEILAAGAKHYGFEFELAEIVRLWQGGCRRRRSLLEDIALALESTPELPNLLCDEELSEKLMSQQEFLRQAAWRAVQWQAPVPATLASLDYLDFHRGAWLPMNLVQPRHKIRDSLRPTVNY
jgi:6-phosphogluconate dehydrogenase